MRTIYSYSGSDREELQRTYADVVRQEYYDGDLSTEPGKDLRIIVQKALAYPISLVRVVSNSGITYRRTWSHIRANKVGVRVIWFVRKGSLKIARSRSTSEVAEGECAILDSCSPFFASATTDGGTFDAVQAIVPAYLFLSHLSAASGFDAPFPLDFEGRDVVVKLLDLLFGDGENLSANAAEPLVAAFLEAIADKVGHLTDAPPKRHRVIDSRLANIKTYIMNNLTDPDLTYDQVAANCGISPRYLCYLLKADETSFSKLVWTQRLLKARDWLVAHEWKDYPIQEIAFMAGFKSAPHFSRMFKAAFVCSPKEYRARHLSRTEAGHQSGWAGGISAQAGIMGLAA